MPEFDSLESKFYWELIRRQLQTMPRQMLEQQCFFALLNMAQQKAIANELRDQLHHVCEVLRVFR
ncbi:MAG: hypothetical protein AAF609_05460 [Cyanobacteria bacterium P01_C01_bin.120]